MISRYIVKVTNLKMSNGNDKPQSSVRDSRPNTGPQERTSSLHVSQKQKNESTLIYPCPSGARRPTQQRGHSFVRAPTPPCARRLMRRAPPPCAPSPAVPDTCAASSLIVGPSVSHCCRHVAHAADPAMVAGAHVP